MVSVRGVSLQTLRLYLVTDQSNTEGRTLTDVVAAAVQGGVSCVQLREKQLNTRDFFAQALLLKELLLPYGIPLVINDRIDVAKIDTQVPWGLEGLRQVRSSTALPLVAIGGIHAGNAREVMLAGANGLAVVSALCAAQDPRAAAAALRKLIDAD